MVLFESGIAQLFTFIHIVKPVFIKVKIIHFKLIGSLVCNKAHLSAGFVFERTLSIFIKHSLQPLICKLLQSTKKEITSAVGFVLNARLYYLAFSV